MLRPPKFDLSCRALIPIQQLTLSSASQSISTPHQIANASAVSVASCTTQPRRNQEVRQCGEGRPPSVEQERIVHCQGHGNRPSIVSSLYQASTLPAIDKIMSFASAIIEAACFSGTSVSLIRAQADQHTGGLGVDQSHELNLVVTLFVIILVDANKVDPEVSWLVRQSNHTKYSSRFSVILRL